MRDHAPVFLRKANTYAERHPEQRLVRGQARKTTKYTCRYCGRDPWPNRFFCKTCHGVVSDSVFQE